MALPIADRNLSAVPLTNAEMLEMVQAWVDSVDAEEDPVGAKFAAGVIKYLTARPVLLRDFALAADTRTDSLGA